MMARRKQLIAAIDVGTTKICTVIARTELGRLRLLGTGTAPSRGLRKGIVVNLSETIESVKASVASAEEQSEAVVESAYVSVGGAYIRGINSSGHTEVRGREITSEDIERAVSTARNLKVPKDHDVIHVLTQNFILDGQEGIIDPLGMFGQQLGVRLHLVINATAIVQNIVNAINKAGIVVDGVVMQQLASSESVLSADEKEMGTFVVDIGGGTTDVAVYSQNSLWHSQVLPMGGNLVTKDIAIGLKAPLAEAEEIKKEAGSVFPESIPSEEMVEIREVGTGRSRMISRRHLCEIVRARCDEILEEIAKITSQVGLNPELVTGAVLTGGGSMLDGLTDRAEQILNMPVRLGYPINVAGPQDDTFHPAFSTALGLLKYANDIQGKAIQHLAASVLSARPKVTTDRMKSWIWEKIS